MSVRCQRIEDHGWPGTVTRSRLDVSPSGIFAIELFVGGQTDISWLWFCHGVGPSLSAGVLSFSLLCSNLGTKVPVRFFHLHGAAYRAILFWLWYMRLGEARHSGGNFDFKTRIFRRSVIVTITMELHLVQFKRNNSRFEIMQSFFDAKYIECTLPGNIRAQFSQFLHRV